MSWMRHMLAFALSSWWMSCDRGDLGGIWQLNKLVEKTEGEKTQQEQWCFGKFLPNDIILGFYFNKWYRLELHVTYNPNFK